MSAVIQTKKLTKKYGDFHAVKDVSLSINPGEIYGFIGLNGAGKTTTFRMLLGLIKPTRGTCSIHGYSITPKNHHIWSHVGHMIETPHAYRELTVEENLHMFRKLRKISQPNVVTNMIDRLHLTRYAKTKAGNLSLGNIQRLGIAKALIHSPDVLILDEPGNGLDPAGILELRQLLQELAYNDGVTILLSSHLLGEVAKIATTLGIIHDGSLVQEISAQKLRTLLNERLLIQTLDNQAAIARLLNEGYSAKMNRKEQIEISSKHALQHPEKISRLLAFAGFPPRHMAVEVEDLEEYFLRVIQQKGASTK